MAKLALNTAIESIHGRISGWVYRKIRGRGFISSRPERLDNPTVSQLEARFRMKEAATYAKAAAYDPVRRGSYDMAAKVRNLPLVAVMVADFLKPPVVGAIDLGGYHGAVGNPIKVSATDDVTVQSVQVAIRASNGTVLEQGAATPDGDKWVYQATLAHAPGQGMTITATATDLPGHTGEKTETWN